MVSKRRFVILGVVVAVIAAVIAWRSTRTSSSRSQGQRPATIATPTATLPAAAAHTRPAPAWFAAHGLPARRIAGRVTLGGAPVLGARVTLHSILTTARHASPLVRTTTADGAFDFGPQPAAAYEVTAAADDATAALERVDLADPLRKPPADQLELRLHACTVFVEGTIVDANGNPLPKAFARRDGLVGLGVETDARGAYKLCLPFGEHAVAYGADGYGGVTLSIDARGEVHRDVVLVPEAAVVVHAVRDADGAPIADAHVVVAPKEWGVDRPTLQTAITDAEGHARITGLLPARYMVHGFSEELMSVAPVEVLAEVGRDAEATVRFGATAQIRGRVMAGTTPLVGARVSAVRTEPLARTPPVFSQSDGAFAVSRVAPGDVRFVVSGHEVEAPLTFRAEAGKRYDDVLLQVRALGTIRGHVTRLGKPAANVGVCCVPTAGSFDQQAYTDADGRYEFAGVAAGTYHLGGGSDEIGAFTLGTKVTLADGETREVDLELDQAGTIAGTVVDRDGKPVKGVFVRWLHEQTGDVGRAITDALGRYRCGAMTGGGRYRAAVFPSADLQQVPYPTADGAPYPVLDVKDGKTLIENVVLRIDRPDLSISGQIVDDVGAPVADALVKARPAAGAEAPAFQSWLRLPMTSTDADGQFTITGLAPGTHALQARAVDGAEGTSPPIAAGASGVVVRIARPGTIEGTLVGFTQQPTVYARALGGTTYVPGVADAKQFRITGLRPARYLVNAQTNTEGDAKVVDIKGGAVTKVELTSHGRGAIDGTVLNFRTRAPVANTACHVVMAAGGETGATNWDIAAQPKSDARGKVAFDPAPAGELVVECLQPQRRWSAPSAQVTLAAGSRASVELLAVELLQENHSTIGARFEWRVTPPRIESITPNSPAAKAGLLAGDLVIAVNGTSVKGLNGSGVAVLIGSAPSGHSVSVTVLRGGATKTFTALAQPDDA